MDALFRPPAGEQLVRYTSDSSGAGTFGGASKTAPYYESPWVSAEGEPAEEGDEGALPRRGGMGGVFFPGGQRPAEVWHAQWEPWVHRAWHTNVRRRDGTETAGCHIGVLEAAASAAPVIVAARRAARAKKEKTEEAEAWRLRTAETTGIDNMQAVHATNGAGTGADFGVASIQRALQRELAEGRRALRAVHVATPGGKDEHGERTTKDCRDPAFDHRRNIVADELSRLGELADGCRDLSDDVFADVHYCLERSPYAKDCEGVAYSPHADEIIAVAHELVRNAVIARGGKHLVQ
jgi:hypothetical protein